MSDFGTFVLETQPGDLPREVMNRAADLTLDLLGVAAGACTMPAAKITRETASQMYGPGPEIPGVPMLFDGRHVSPAGAALATSTQIDALDAHDGFSRTKGHAGCGLIGAALASAYSRPDMSGPEFLTTLTIGYEIACRAGLGLHDTVSDYHTSGAWVALACAAIVTRMNDGDRTCLRDAVGIAEYHGPRSQMMREIDNPSMLHDGSGWGAMVGVVSAELARRGFLGAPAITIEAPDVAQWWQDLGTRWLTLEQNIKLFPICRWAHAPIQAALTLRAEHSLAADAIESIEIHAFHESTRLAQSMPETISAAQYSLAFPVAAAFCKGAVGPAEIDPSTFGNPDIARLVAATKVQECDVCNAGFPDDRLGRVVVHMADGQSFDSAITQAPGEHTAPISRAGLKTKYRDYSLPVLGAERSAAIEEAVFALCRPNSRIGDLLALLHAPAGA